MAEPTADDLRLLISAAEETLTDTRNDSRIAWLKDRIAKWKQQLFEMEAPKND